LRASGKAARDGEEKYEILLSKMAAVLFPNPENSAILADGTFGLTSPYAAAKMVRLVTTFLRSDI
jgi:hypothetical protein